EDGIRDDLVTGVQTCALPILRQFRFPWPQLSAAMLASATRWLMVAVVATGLAWLWRAMLMPAMRRRRAVWGLHRTPQLEERARKIGRASWRERGEVGGEGSCE